MKHIKNFKIFEAEEAKENWLSHFVASLKGATPTIDLLRKFKDNNKETISDWKGYDEYFNDLQEQGHAY
jgi:hypothetical protein